MATTQIQEKRSTTRLSPREATLTRVFTKTTWDGEWELRNYLRCLQVREAAWPNGNEAVLDYYFGQVKQADVNSNAEADLSFDPLDLTGHYVKVETVGRQADQENPTPDGDTQGVSDDSSTDDEQPRVLFVGVIVTDEREVYRKFNDNEPGGGMQQIQATDLSYLLARVKISLSYMELTDGSGVRVSERPINVNEPVGVGLHGYGNRSAAKHTGADGDSYVLAPFGAAWTTADLIEYLFANFNAPCGFELTGQTEALDQMIRADGRIFGLTVKQVIERLIDRRRGLGCKTVVETDDEGNEAVKLEVFTMLDEDIGDIPANTNTLDLNVDTRVDLADVTVAQSITQRYGAIEVRGAPSRVMFTATFISPDTPALTEGWPASDEEDYRTAVGESDSADDNDAQRSNEALAHVFRRWVINPDWQWQINGKTIVPRFDQIGRYKPVTDSDEANNEVSVPDWGGTLGRQLLIEEEADPNGSGPVNYRKPFAGIMDPNTNQWHLLHALDAAGAPSMGLEVLDHQMGIQLTGAYGHLIAKNHWDDETPAPTASENTPQFDYETGFITAAAETDVRPKVSLDIIRSDDVAEPEGVLMIEVPDVQFWVAAPNTVKDVNGTQLTYYNEDYGVIRDDTARLRHIARLALQWYKKPRRPVQLRFDRVAADMRPGVLLRAVWGNQTYDPVDSVITDVTHDFENNETVAQTQHAELDFRGI